MVILAAGPVWERRHKSKIPLVVTILLFLTSTAKMSKHNRSPILLPHAEVISYASSDICRRLSRLRQVS